MYRLSTGTFFIFYFVAVYTFRVTLGLRDQTHYFLVKLVKFAVHECAYSTAMMLMNITKTFLTLVFTSSLVYVIIIIEERKYK